MILRILFFCFLILPSIAMAAIQADCESALKTLFAKNVSQAEAADFLKVQGDLTLHRLAWAYLKAQKTDQGKKLESVERTILNLLDDKYASLDPGFIKARNQFEAQPLSRTALADLGPYLKEVLSQQFGKESQAFILNASDLKLLHSLSKFEKERAVHGKYDGRMLGRRAPEGMLNFAKLVNAQYKKTTNATEDSIQIDMKLQGLERTIGSLQKKVNTFISSLPMPTVCRDDLQCSPGDQHLGELFAQNEAVQKIFWASLDGKLSGDDVLMDNLSYGKLWIGGNSSMGGDYASSTGLYIKDPVSVILKDDPKRQATAYKSMGKDYLFKMADAVLSDDTTFEHQGKLYLRKTGRALSLDQSLNLLPKTKRSVSYKDPLYSAAKLAAQAKGLKSFSNDGKEYDIDGTEIDTPRRLAALIGQSPGITAQFVNDLINARLNGNKTFIYEGNLFSTDGSKLDPATQIASEISKKTNSRVPAGKYEGMDSHYLLVRSEALANNKPHFKLGNQVYDTESGRNLTSPTRALRHSEDTKIQKKKRVQYQGLSDTETVINYHRDHPNKDGCQYYAIVDKKTVDVTVYNLKGQPVYHKPVLVGSKTSDEKTRWTEYDDRNHQGNYTTGAGVFTIGKPKTGEYYEKNYENNLLQIEDQRVFAIHEVPTYLQEQRNHLFSEGPDARRVSQGCVNMLKEDFIELAKWMKPSCQLYVLPEESNNKFIVKDDKIVLTSTAKVDSKVVANYNYPGAQGAAKPHPITITITDDKARTAEAQGFVSALQSEKANLMGKLHLTNDEYNDLATLAFGVMGNESEFGEGKKLWLKEHGQSGVIAAKMVKSAAHLKNPLSEDNFNTSRGYTQIKDIPHLKSLQENYPDLSKDTLLNPKNSAVATMAYLSDALKVMKSVAAKNEAGDHKVRISTEKMVDYLGYLYQGRKKMLTNDNSTIDINPSKYILSLKKNMSYVEVSQQID